MGELEKAGGSLPVKGPIEPAAPDNWLPLVAKPQIAKGPDTESGSEAERRLDEAAASAEDCFLGSGEAEAREALSQSYDSLQTSNSTSASERARPEWAQLTVDCLEAGESADMDVHFESCPLELLPPLQAVEEESCASSLGDDVPWLRPLCLTTSR